MIKIRTLRAPDKLDLVIANLAIRLSYKSQGDNFSPVLLSKAVLRGDDHAKAIRNFLVKYRLDAPRYFWHEFVTYRIGNEQLGSESTMHSAPKFKTEEEFIKWKENYPEGTMQARIFMTSYQTLRHMYFARRNHRLPDWRHFCVWIETLPWAEELITIK